MAADRKQLLAYLRSKNMMQVATAGSKPWICTVYYAVGNDCALYFISDPKARHSRIIGRNPRVAVAITDTHQKATSKKAGVQLEGRAQRITNRVALARAVALWNKAVPGMSGIITVENITGKKIDGAVYCIVPTSAKFFNETLYGPEGFRIIRW